MIKAMSIQNTRPNSVEHKYNSWIVRDSSIEWLSLFLIFPIQNFHIVGATVIFLSVIEPYV